MRIALDHHRNRQPPRRCSSCVGVPACRCHEAQVCRKSCQRKLSIPARFNALRDASVLPHASGRPRKVNTRSSTEPLATRLQRMIGRDSIVAKISSQLLSKRFIALSGPGGMGRTTVAVAVALSLVADFGEAMCVVDLGKVEDCSRVVHAIASALGCHTDMRDPVSGLLTFLADKEMLLVLDSCERVIETVAELTERPFNEAPLVHVLTTSRTALYASSMSLFLGARHGFALAREDRLSDGLKPRSVHVAAAGKQYARR